MGLVGSTVTQTMAMTKVTTVAASHHPLAAQSQAAAAVCSESAGAAGRRPSSAAMTAASPQPLRVPREPVVVRPTQRRPCGLPRLQQRLVKSGQQQ